MYSAYRIDVGESKNDINDGCWCVNCRLGIIIVMTNVYNIVQANCIKQSVTTVIYWSLGELLTHSK